MREPSELDAPRVCAEVNGGDIKGSFNPSKLQEADVDTGLQREVHIERGADINTTVALVEKIKGLHIC